MLSLDYRYMVVQKVCCLFCPPHKPNLYSGYLHYSFHVQNVTESQDFTEENDQSSEARI